MSSQTVNFVNPTVITSLQSTTAGTALKDAYISQVFNSGASANLASYYGAARAAAFAGQSGAFAIVNNSVTDETASFYTGIRNPAGQPITADTQVRLHSLTKILLAGPVIAKCLEERWFTPADAVSTYVPEWNPTQPEFIGATGVFIDNVTNLQIPTYPYPTLGSAGGWTGVYDLVPFALSDIKMSHLMSMSVGLAYDFEGCYGVAPSWGLTGTFAAAIGATGYSTGASKPNIVANLLYQNDLCITGELRGVMYTARQINTYGADSSQAQTDYGLFNYTYFETIAQRKLPLAHRPGTAFIYGPSLELLGGVLNRIALQRGYSGLDDFIRQKIFTPMGIDQTKLWSNCDTPVPTAYTDNHLVGVFNRAANSSYSFGAGNWNFGVTAVDPLRDPAYPLVQGNNVPVGQGPLVWANQYKYDSLVWAYYTALNTAVYSGNTGSYQKYNATIAGGWCGTPSEAIKLAKMLSNKGIYNGKRIISEAAIRFLETPAQPYLTDPGVAGTTMTVVNGALFGGLANYDQDNTTWKAAQAVGWAKDFTTIIAAPTSNPGTQNTPNSTYPSISLQFPFSDNTYMWAGAERTRMIYDTASNNISICGSQLNFCCPAAITNAPDALVYVANNLLECTKV